MTRLKELRSICGKTQADIAAVIGVTRAAYTNIENGKRQPDSASLLKLAQYFNVSVDYLLGRDCESEQKEKPPADTGEGPSKSDNELYNLLMDLPEDKLRDALNYIRYLKSLSDNE